MADPPEPMTPIVAAPLDAFLPQPAHRSRYETVVAASPETTWAAMLAVTPRELPLTRMLAGVRAAPGRLLGGGHGGPADAPDEPVVAQFVAAGFGVLQEDRPRLLILGAAGQPWRLRGGERHRFAGPAEFAAFDRPAQVRMVLSFELAPSEDGGTRLAAETRVTPTDASAARAFGRYWTAIRLGGGAIRLDLLRGIRRRAGDGPARSPAAPV